MDEPGGEGRSRPEGGTDASAEGEPPASAGSDTGDPSRDTSPERLAANARETSQFAERRSVLAGGRLGPPSSRVTLIILTAILIACLLYMGREAVRPFVVGLLLVYLLDPPVERLGRLGLPRWMAVLIVYAIVIFVLVEALSLMLTPLVDQISQVIADLPTLAGQLDTQLQRLSDFYRGLDLPPQIREAVDNWVAEMSQGGAGIDLGFLSPVVNVTAGLIGAIVGYLIIPVWVFYLLKDRPQLTRAVDRALPPEWRTDVWNIVTIAARVFGQWIRGQLFLGLTVAAFTFVGLLVLAQVIHPIFGTYALLLAIIAGLFELLPIIGPIIAAIPAVLLAATAGLEAAIAALVLYTVVQQVENNLLVPKIQGDAVNLHPSVVMFALVVGGAIAGLLGAILALPITATGRDIFRYLFSRLGPPTDPVAAESSDA